MSGQGYPGPTVSTGQGALHPTREGSHRHHAILKWLLLNPHRTLGECARELGYTQSWLSTIIHSDMFQAEYQEACRQANVVAVHSIQSKLGYVAARALEKTVEKLDSGQYSEKFLGDTTKNVLAAMGYTKGPELHLHQHRHVEVPREALMRAREEAQKRLEGSTPLKNAWSGVEHVAEFEEVA